MVHPCQINKKIFNIFQNYFFAYNVFAGIIVPKFWCLFLNDFLLTKYGMKNASPFRSTRLNLLSHFKRMLHLCCIFSSKLTPKELNHCPFSRQMGFGAGIDELNLCCDFLILFLKIEKLNSFMEIEFFLIGAWEQKLCPNKLKIGEIG